MRLELTRRGDYAVRAMLALASVDGSTAPLSARRIAEQMSIPERFLPHVLRDLVRAGLVEARTGRTGGYRLARPAESIALLDVVEAAEGEAEPARCVLRGGSMLARRPVRRARRVRRRAGGRSRPPRGYEARRRPVDRGLVPRIAASALSDAGRMDRPR